MENRINSRVVIAVNKKGKLLRYLRKLNSEDIEGVSVGITHTPKERPINLYFVKSGAEGNYLVYAWHGKVMNKEMVVLGSATIRSLQEIGFVLGRNNESKECVVINVYAKEYALDFKELQDNFKELQDVLFSIKRLSIYINSSTTILELKPENKNIISYEVSMIPKSLVDLATAKKETYKRESHYAYHSKDSNSTATESEKGTQEVLRGRHAADSNRSKNIQLEIVIASSIIKSDLKKPLEKWIKILKTEPIEILTDTYFTAGYIVGFYIKKSTFGTNGATIDNERTPRYELVAKYSLSDYTINSRDRGITTPGFALKALHNAYVNHKQRKSENLDISDLESILEEDQNTSNQKEDLFCKKAKINSRKHKEISPVSFGCSIPNIFIQRLRIKDNKSINTENLSATFEIGNKIFKGTIAKASIDTDSVMSSFPIAKSISTGVSLEILIDNDSKKIIQNLLDKTGLETAAVGKLMLNYNTNHGSTDTHKLLKQIGVIWVSRDSLLSNKYSSSNKDTNTAQPYQIPPVTHPTVSILGNSDLKKKIKEIIEEANRSKSFPYELDYDNNCVMIISNSLFNVLESKNKLEDVLKLKKVIDVGVFHLEDTGDLAIKKRFNISSLTVYYSDSKKLYALIGA